MVRFMKRFVLADYDRPMQNVISIYQMQVINHLLTPTTLPYRDIMVQPSLDSRSHIYLSPSDPSTSRLLGKRADHCDKVECIGSIFQGCHQLL